MPAIKYDAISEAKKLFIKHQNEIPSKILTGLCKQACDSIALIVSECETPDRLRNVLLDIMTGDDTGIKETEKCYPAVQLLAGLLSSKDAATSNDANSQNYNKNFSNILTRHIGELRLKCAPKKVPAFRSIWQKPNVHEEEKNTCDIPKSTSKVEKPLSNITNTV